MGTTINQVSGFFTSGTAVFQASTEAQANTERSAEIWAQRLNDDLIFRYHGRAHDASISILNGSSVPWPSPEVSWVPVQNTDGTWTIAQTGPPVCPAEPMPELAKPYVPKAIPGPSNMVQAPVGDVMPLGYRYTDAAGKTWQKMSSPTPLGMAYFYQVVA